MSLIILTGIKEEEKPARCVASGSSLCLCDCGTAAERSARCRSYINRGAPEPSRANIHTVQSTECDVSETVEHVLFECSKYDDQRNSILAI